MNFFGLAILGFGLYMYSKAWCRQKTYFLDACLAPVLKNRDQKTKTAAAGGLQQFSVVEI